MSLNRPKISDNVKALSQSTTKLKPKEEVTTSGNKFNDLYEMGRYYNKRLKADRDTEEIEYERNKDECTFTPNCKRV